MIATDLLRRTLVGSLGALLFGFVCIAAATSPAVVDVRGSTVALA